MVVGVYIYGDECIQKWWWVYTDMVLGERDMVLSDMEQQSR